MKLVAERYGIEVRTPRTLRDESEQAHLAAPEPDAVCVAAYGMILPPEVLAIPRYGCINVHASLLPAWRGAAPVERAILAGDTETGVCVMRMEEGLDTGAYCICRTASMEDKSAAALSDELANLGSHGASRRRSSIFKKALPNGSSRTRSARRMRRKSRSMSSTFVLKTIRAKPC